MILCQSIGCYSTRCELKPQCGYRVTYWTYIWNHSGACNMQPALLSLLCQWLGVVGPGGVYLQEFSPADSPQQSCQWSGVGIEYRFFSSDIAWGQFCNTTEMSCYFPLLQTDSSIFLYGHFSENTSIVLLLHLSKSLQGTCPSFLYLLAMQGLFYCTVA